MLARLIAWSIELRAAMAALVVVVLAAGVVAARTLPVDAVPDVTTVQVTVLTEARGLSPAEVERSVTLPIEMALNGAPRLVELRSVSRTGLSAVTVIFEDATDIWFARQVVLERVRSAEGSLPAAASKPELSPVSGGLGEIYQFVVRSDLHTPMQLRTILDWDIVPRLRSVPGVIEVNTMGGELKEYQIVIDHRRLHAQGLTLDDVATAVELANVTVGGGYVERGPESLALRGVGTFRSADEIGEVVLRDSPKGTPVLVRHVGEVRIGAALRYGVTTHDGRAEAVTGTVMMLAGANSREVVGAVRQRVAEVRRDLPPGVAIEPIYDRSEFVGRTLHTVLGNLLEGALVVLVVLTVFLGTLRGALVVVLGIPVSMAVALGGMHLFGVTGDLMSLGAIDFGFLVDGPVVLLEAITAAAAGRSLVGSGARSRAYGETMAVAARPVAFAVAIILLVYLPLLSLQGIEGKMFRPMAITMACALFGALLYSVLFFPALCVLVVPPPERHGARPFDLLHALSRGYRRVLPAALRARLGLLAGSAAALVAGSVLVARSGADFIPRIDEGDIVVTIRRAPSIGLSEAKRLDLAVEETLRGFPEVSTTLAMTGRAEVAIDPVGNDNTDVFVHLRPRGEWTTAHDLDALSEAVKRRVEREVPGTFVSVSQPIEDKTNELISGSRADVQIQIFGPELAGLKRLSERVGATVRGIPGAGDVRVERVLGLPQIVVRPDRARLARYGMRTQDALSVLEAARVGRSVGRLYEEQKRFDVRLLSPPREPTPEALAELFVEASGGKTVPLGEVADIDENEGPTQIRRERLTRTVRVEVNLRGRDLVSWVREAQDKVAAEVALDPGYTIEWGGQFENFERASRRLALVVPMALGIIATMLLWMFGSARYAAAVFAVVPFGLVGGFFGLVARGLPFSIPAAVGFVALTGVSVLNGVVLASEVKRRLDAGAPLATAAVDGASAALRAVLTTGAVATLGFLPMVLATGAGAEVQRPLATVVVSGIALSSLLTLFLLPGVIVSIVRDPVGPFPHGVAPSSDPRAGR